jgi:hypothetical protein
MHTTLRLLRDRDSALRAARKPVLNTPVTLSPHLYATLEHIQETEEGLRWLLNSKPRLWRQRSLKQRNRISA